MHFLFSGVFWGLILILLGISMILKIVFKVDIPLFRIVIALILIYWGLKLLFGISLGKKSEGNIIFNRGTIEQVETGKEYNIIFGRGTVDLRDLQWHEQDQKVSIDVVFGNADIYLNPDIPTQVNIDAVFAECRFPGGNISFMGDHTLRTPSYEEGKPYITIDLDVVFGNAAVKD